MSTRRPATYSTRELRAAAAALAAGQFTAPARTRRSPSETPADHDAAPLSNEGTVAPAAGDGNLISGGTKSSTGLGQLVRVRAANAGAGASTIALALADAAAVAGVRTRVIDAATPEWSGLSGATDTELGSAESWRRGRRGDRVLIDRVEAPIRTPSEVPRPRCVAGVDLTVLDTGWSRRELAACDPGSWVATAAAQADVLVTRPHRLALHQAEAALADLQHMLTTDRVVIVVIGATRWSRREFASAGSLLSTAHERGAVVLAPLLPAQALPGLGADRLPKKLADPARQLLARLTTITGPLAPERDPT